MAIGKGGRKRYIILLFVAIIIVGGYVFYRVKKQNFLDHQLPQMVKDKTKQLYNVTYDSIYVDEVGGDVYLKNIHFRGDTSLQLQMINNKDSNAASVIFDIFVPSIKVVDFKTARALLSKQMECKEVIISNPKVLVYFFPGQGKQTDKKKQQEALYKQVLGNFKLIKADSLSVINCEVIAADFYTKDVKFHTFNSSVNLSQLAVDSTYNEDRSRTLFCKDITLSSAKIVLGDKKNTGEINQFRFDTRTNVVSLSAITYDAFKNNGFFKAKLEGISMQGLQWLGPADNSDLVVDKVVVDKGELETLADPDKESKSKSKNDPKILTGWIRNFSLNDMTIKSVTYISKTAEVKDKAFVVKNNSFSIKHVSIDRTSAFNGKLINQAKEIVIKNDAITLKSADGLYAYKLVGLSMNTKAKGIAVKTFQVIPLLNEAAFAKKAHYQTDRYDIVIKNLRGYDVDAEKLVKGELDIGSVTTSGNSIKVFRDLSYPVDSISRAGQQNTYPNQLIHQYGMPIQIDRLTVSNTNIEYKERNDVSKKSGRVRFSNSTINMKNISTHKAKPGEMMTAAFRTMFLDKIPLTGAFTFMLDNWQKGTFTAEAKVSQPVDATMLNELTMPMSLMKIESGVIRSVTFFMKADTNTSKGTLVMPYEDLRLSLLKKQGDKYNKKGVMSVFANILVKNNNKEGENMRKGDILLTRNKYRTFFNFIWMTIFKGVKDVAVLKL